MERKVIVDGLRLDAHVAAPRQPGPVPAVVICHGFPTDARGAATAAATLPQLADRIARECSWIAMSFTFRGAGGSDGDFSGDGWVRDVSAAVGALDERPDVLGVWVIGIREGGTIALCAATADDRIRGLATLAAPASLRDVARDANRLLEEARNLRLVRAEEFPPDAAAWARGVAALDAVAAATALDDRPLFVLHGSDDRVVLPDDARRIAAAAGPHAELHIIQAAGNRLRHDPRAVAALLGWLDRQVHSPGVPMTDENDAL
ncbi:MAG: alpha/beta hydrolase family protein [Acidimicrobiia bacterium]